MFIDREKMNTLIKDAELNGVPKTALMDNLISRGYEIEGVDRKQALNEIAKRARSKDTTISSSVLNRVREVPSFLGTNERTKDIPQDIMQTGRNISESFSRGKEKIVDAMEKGISGEQSLGSATFQSIGEGLGTASNIVGDVFLGGLSLLTTPEEEEAIKKGVENIVGGVVNSDAVRSIVDSDIVKSVIDYYADFRKKHPEAARNLEATGGFVKAALDVWGAGEGINQLKKGVTKASDAVISATDKIDDVAKNIKIPEISIPNGTDIVDNAIIGVNKTIKGAKKLSEKAADTVKKSVDRQNIKLAKANPQKAEEKIVDLYREAVVPGVKGKKKAISAVKDYDKAVVDSVKKLSKYDVSTLEDFSNALSSEKRAIWKNIEDGLKKADESGVKISLEPVVSDLREALKHEKTQFSPEIRKAIEKRLKLFTDENGKAKSISPTVAQDLMADYNNILKPFYKGSSISSSNMADGLVLSNINRNLRSLVDNAIEKLDGKTYGEFKKAYKDLKTIEDDVVHRAIYEAQKGAGLGKYADAFAAGDIIGGMVGTNPAFLAKGIGQKLIGDISKQLSDKNELIRQMFTISKELPSQKVLEKVPKSQVNKVVSYTSNDTPKK